VAGAKQREDHFRIVLDDDQQLLRLYARDLQLGGLFIPTELPPPLNREIHVDFEFPSREVFGFAARVVQRVPAGQDGDALQAGVAVVFDDPSAVLARLRPFLEQGTIALGPVAADSEDAPAEDAAGNAAAMGEAETTGETARSTSGEGAGTSDASRSSHS
jgi:Tfp pilus assembly protein PilZ